MTANLPLREAQTTTIEREVLMTPHGWFMVRRVCIALLCAWMTLTSVSAQSQQSKPPRQQKRWVLIVTGGVGIPLARPGLTDFWNVGGSVSLNLLQPVNRSVMLGMGFDAATLYFDALAFSVRYPGVPFQKKNLAYLNPYVTGRFTLKPGTRLSPFVSLNVGVARVTPASQMEVISGVRHIYYNIPGRWRLATSVSGGADLVLSRWFAVVGEAKLTYVHNDPDLGANCALRLGARFTF